MQQPKIELTKEQQKIVSERIHRSACFQRAFKGADGEFTLKEIDTLTHYKNPTFDPNPYQSAYNAGQRSVSVFIHNVLEQDIDEARKLLGEENEKQKHSRSGSSI